jgi:hypothetical protein
LGEVLEDLVDILASEGTRLMPRSKCFLVLEDKLAEFSGIKKKKYRLDSSLLGPKSLGHLDD